MRQRRALAWILAAAAALAAAPPATAAATADRQQHHPSPSCPRLSGALPWYGENRERLQEVIDERGDCSGRGSLARLPRPARAGGAPVAAFDWDNTVTKNDVTDATLAWALKHDKILRPARWKATSKWLTDAADKALTGACGTDVPVGRPLPTSRDADCADEILQIREKAATMSGAAAFAGEWNHRRTVPQYAWVPQLFAGHTVDELSSYARRARAEALAAPVGATQRVGTHTLPAYVRYYAQQRDLIRTLQKAGFEVYIVSAGSEPVTEVWSRGVGVDADHTIAIRSVLDRRGRITTKNEGCGGVPVNHGEAIPYIDGKRCWINQEIYGVKGAAAWERQDARHRISIGGGDADTDVTFVGDATDAHLVLNRNKDEIMCRAYDDADGRWLVNPMFIDPLPRRQEPYPCSTGAYNEPAGGKGPVRRADGSVVPDQKDTVY
ncbi:haloacid dehalogenase-like hydrolase [Streptomyces minutiscleroticus]|uniref:phosphoserine phosphatase n=1 Tax=Streptomyces minutiscleroticus TaxID=68238 RepID=A0A918NXQ1_9ACTN|nr:haloacid dehalogenase-like hydrolase [Streptomyces minutiscleroticus]GGY02739.1 putative conserved lipoprotein LppF [Streptomyces minutiscleroticus]